MKIAYIISAYKLPEMLVRLVERLNTDATHFFIHVDKKTDRETYARMTHPLSSYTNVQFLKRHICNWGDFGHVEATLKGIHEIITQQIDFDYVFLLTGQDYPIKSNQAIQDFLQDKNGYSFLDYTPLPYTNWSDRGGLDRIEYYHLNWRGQDFAILKEDQLRQPFANRLRNSVVRLLPFRRHLPKQLSPYGGSSYWCLSKECIEYLFTFMHQSKNVVNFFRYVRVPDEIFFQTVLINSHLASKVINDDLRYIDWSKPTPPHPAILRKEDFEQFIKTDKLFARKFDPTIDADVLDWIDREIQ